MPSSQSFLHLCEENLIIYDIRLIKISWDKRKVKTRLYGILHHSFYTHKALTLC